MGELLAQKNTFKEEEKKINTGQEELSLNEVHEEKVTNVERETTDPQTYSHNEAFKASLEYFKGDELAARVWVNKYAMKDSFGNLFEKTPDDMHHRMANQIHCSTGWPHDRYWKQPSGSLSLKLFCYWE